MRQSLVFREALSNSIKQEIAERTQLHQAKMAALKAQQAVHPDFALAEPATRQPAPLVLLAHGDSWFDYPLNGNLPSLNPTDIVAQLESLGTPSPLILNISHYGDATSDELAWPKQQRMIDALNDPANWPASGKPDAILFSGGGNDIAGNQFCIYLDYVGTPGGGLNRQRFQGVLDMVMASYLDLFLFRDRNAKGVPVIGHCYDFAIPNGVPAACIGPWLLPSLKFNGWDTPQGTAILHDALTAFHDMLHTLAADAQNNFILVETQGTLAPAQWANELHPTAAGFQLIAGKFVAALRAQFHGRI